jgi:hypothetical protein
MSRKEWESGLIERCSQVVTAYKELYAHLDIMKNIEEYHDVSQAMMQTASDEVENMIVALDALS